MPYTEHGHWYGGGEPTQPGPRLVAKCGGPGICEECTRQAGTEWLAPMTQTAPYPELLYGLVDRLTYKAGWRFSLADIDRGQGSEGLTLVINLTGPDSYHTERTISVNHYMIVPAASYDERAWQWWLLQQLLAVESHEACEFFQIDGDRPYAPNHGPGRDPYQLLELGSMADAQTSFRGIRKGGASA
jgi:hypothetical protein